MLSAAQKKKRTEYGFRVPKKGFLGYVKIRKRDNFWEKFVTKFSVPL